MSNGKDWGDVLSIIQNAQEDMRELISQWADFISPTPKDVTFVFFDGTTFVVPNVQKVIDSFTAEFAAIEARLDALELWRTNDEPKIAANVIRSTDNETSIDGVIPAVDLVTTGTTLNDTIDKKLSSVNSLELKIRVLDSSPAVTVLLAMEPDTTVQPQGQYAIVAGTYLKELGAIRYQFYLELTTSGYPAATDLARIAFQIPSALTFGFDLSLAPSHPDVQNCVIQQNHITDAQLNEMKNVFCRIDTNATAFFGASTDAIVIGPQEIVRGNSGIFGGAASGVLYTTGQLLARIIVRGEIWVNLLNVES